MMWLIWLKSALIFVLLFAFWPAAYLFSGYFVQGEISHLVIHEVFNFVPLSIISAFSVVLPMWSRRYGRCLLWGLSGFLVGTPIAYFASIYGSLIMAPWLSATVLGGFPMLVFTFIGYKVGHSVQSYASGYSFG